jgi:hypothetical protein
LKQTIAAAVVVGYIGAALLAAQPAGDGPRYSNGTNLIRPANYREWVFLGAGLDMTYQPTSADGAGPQHFSNVFVNPSAHRAFMQTGKWPDGSIFVLEIRAAGSEGAINQNTTARYQTAMVALEAEVKDSRFPDGWAFFDFGRAASLRELSEPLAGDRVARCIECHTKHAAVERTFVQFYPTLLEVARKMGTVKPGF